MKEAVGRKEDMSPDGRLRIWVEDDGDVIVEIIKLYDDNGKRLDGLERLDVQFCTPGSGGGRSPETRRALLALMEAIEKDNESCPSASDPALAAMDLADLNPPRRGE